MNSTYNDTITEIKQALLQFTSKEITVKNYAHEYAKSNLESKRQVIMLSALAAVSSSGAVESAVIETVRPEDIDSQQFNIYGTDYQHFLTATDDDFETLFRINRKAMHRLTSILQHRLDIDSSEASMVPMKKKVMLTCWLMGNQEPFSTAGTMFNVTTTNAYQIFHEMCYQLTILAGRFIRWPSAAECSHISKIFAVQHAIPGVIGVIGYCHVNIRAPEEKDEMERFWNAEAQRHTILLQLVVDNAMLIRDVCAGFSGSTSVLNAFLRSPLFPRLTSTISPLTKEDEHLLGTSIYPQLPNLLTPYTFETNKRALTDQEQKFNDIHRTASSVVDQTCASLKTRFQRLNFIDVCQPELASKVVIAACVLHNFAILSCR